MYIPISERIAKPEGKTLAFKRDLSSPKNILKTVVAFANTAGGHILIGVDDDSREIVSISDPLDEEERLCSLIADSIAPGLVPEIELVSINNKTLLAVEVYPGSQRPYYLKKEGPFDGVYVRLGSTNRKADQELISELRRSVSGISFDEMPLPDLTGDDLDTDAARRQFRGQRDLTDEEILTLKLLVPVQGKLVPTTGGMLLFGKKREYYFPDAWIQCGRFIGVDKAYIFDHIEIHEHLPDAVGSVMLFLKKHAFRGADFSGIRRRDVWSIPLTILREAIINAIVHADYSQKGAPIRVSFFDDRIEIENPGILLPGMIIEDVKHGVSKIRNRVIARVFKELDLIEQWGSGFRRILREAKDLGLPEPEIIEIGMRVRVTVFLKEALPIENVYRFVRERDARPELQPELRPELQPGLMQETKRESPLSQKVIINLSIRDMGMSELAERVGHKSVSGELKKQVRYLLNHGYIEMTIPDKPNSKNQKYRLTAKGRAFLSQMPSGK
ncbi:MULTISPECIES: AlbA family DNA-binding domain-containing protein [Methanocalculus]|uniref:AlbA family DNA-binding domain-containing protein n=1 Tax=Methanocalculus TaxID=71151 RepID=UPI0020A17C46|nr:helix-turn-helix domain-containing protein [Methanocalculus sp. AMF5]MCP1662143.1 putative HTH transcriptional regulator [Methanocalculus sp. AMF5]